MYLVNALLGLLILFLVYGSLFIFFFFLVISLGLKERDTKLKIREITGDLFKLIFR